MYQITNLELAVLGLIAEAPRYGYQIELEVQERGMREWAEIGFSSIYHVLNKLEKNGWLTSVLESSSQGPARKVYSLSEPGRDGIHDAVLTRLASPRRYSSDLELALATIFILSPAEITHCLNQYSSELHIKIQQLTIKWEADRRNGLPDHVEWLFDHSLNALNCELGWIQQLKGKFERI